MTDIIDEVVASFRQIRIMQQGLRDADHSCGEPSCHRLLEGAWDRIGRLIEISTDAELEVCFPFMFGTGPPDLEQLRDAVADIRDLREAVDEARLQPAASPGWRRAATAARSLCMRHLDCQERALARYCRRAPRSERMKLAGQWRAFSSARMADLVPSAQRDGQACQFCRWPLTGGHRHVLDSRSLGIYCSCDVCHGLFQQLKACPDHHRRNGTLSSARAR